MNLKTISKMVFLHPVGLLVAFVTLFVGWQGATAQSSRALQTIDFNALGNERVELVLTLNENAPDPVVFTVDKPARLSLDFPDTRVAVADRFKRINIGRTRSVAVAEAKGRTRVVIELSELSPYNLRREGNKVFVTLGGGTDLPAVATAKLPTAQVNSIDFRRGEKGEGRVVVNLSDVRTVVDVTEEGGKIIARFKNTGIGEALLRRLDVLDFATPVKFVDVSREGINTQMVITPVKAADFEQVAYQSGSQFILELLPLTLEKQEERKKAEPQYVGERITLNFQSVDIRSLLQIIADVAGTNLVVSDTVTGDVAMRLQNVPWDQALDIILRTKGLGMRQQGNVMVIAPAEELANREKAELTAEKDRQQLAPLRSELIQVNYAKASEIAALLKTGENSILSDRGRVTVDERTNTLLVLDTREKLTDVRNLVVKLDIPVRQVLIETRVVVANDDYSKELGARFGVSGVNRNGGNGLATTSGNLNATDATVQDFLNDGFPVTVGTLADRFNVSLPVGTPAGRLALSVLGSRYLLDMELSAMQAEGRGEVVSAPRVITANSKQALIEQGVEIPFQQAASSGATNIAFKKAVLSLTVTPQITPDNRIIMDLAVNKDSVGQQVANTLGGTIPAIDTRKVQTQVLVNNGQTVVLGGIYEQDSRQTTTKVPLLGDIPLLGVLFRTNSNVSNKRELLIFVTPKILSESLKLD
jgi:type IV pilus assembly protein PilQ